MNVPTSTLVAGGIVPAGYCCCWVCSNIPRWGSVKHLPFMTWSVPHGSDYLRWGGSFRLGFYYSAGTAECFSVDLAPLPVAGWGRGFLWIVSDRKHTSTPEGSMYCLHNSIPVSALSLSITRIGCLVTFIPLERRDPPESPSPFYQSTLSQALPSRLCPRIRTPEVHGYGT